MKKHSYTIVLIILSIILAVVSFYMLFVHVPYYHYQSELNQIKDEICETNGYIYQNYFNEHRGKQIYYILYVYDHGHNAYVAYDKDLNLIDSYSGIVTSSDDVKASIIEKYSDKEISIEDISLEIGYENNKFVYTTKLQEEDSVLYIYYDLDDGDFLKAYHLSKKE